MAAESKKRTLAEIQDDLEEEMNKKLDENPTIGDLLNKGLTRLQFKRDSATTSRNCSDHQPIDAEVTNLGFGVLSGGEYVKKRHFPNPSMVMRWCNSEAYSGVLHYTSENEIQHAVNLLFSDIKIATGLNAKITLKKVCFLGMGSNMSDFWLVLTATGRPIMVIEVKSPNTK